MKVRKWFGRKIQRQIVMVTFSSIVIAIFLNFWDGLVTNYTSVEQRVRVELANSAANTAKTVEFKLKLAEDDLRFLRETPPIQGIIRALDNQGIDPKDGSTLHFWTDRMAIIFQGLLLARPQYFQVNYILADGSELVRVELVNQKLIAAQSNALNNYSNAPFLKQALALSKEGVYASPLALQKDKGGNVLTPYKPTIDYAVAMRDSHGNLRGVLRVSVYGDSFLNELKSHSTHESMLLGPQGQFFISPQPNRSWAIDLGNGSNIQNTFPEIVDNIISKESGTIITNSKAFAFTRLYPNSTNHDTYWIYLEDVQKDILFAPVYQFIRNSIIILVLSLTFDAILGFYMMRRVVVRPIEDLLRQMNRFSQGDYGIRVASSRRDEIGALSLAFDRMVESIIHSQQELLKEKSSVETRVQEAVAKIQEQKEELTEALKKLKETQVQLIQTEKMSSLGQMVAGVAHEINNPVNFIHGNLTHINEYTKELLDTIRLYQKYYPNAESEIKEKSEAIDLHFIMEDIPKIAESMKVGTERIRQIVLSLRNFSRLDESEMKEVNIHEGLDNTLLILQHKLKAKPEHPEIEVVREYGELPLVECYVGQLNQVFMNILINAIDALDSYNPTFSAKENRINPSKITIRTEFVQPDLISIKIADNGPGITEEVKQRIFDPFFTTKPVGKGTGLGLSISYQIIVEQHGGSLKCFSQLGSGTELWIKIPVKQ